MAEDRRLLTAAELSERLHMSRDQIYKLARSGRIPAHWFGQWRFDWDEIMQQPGHENGNRDE